MTRIDTAGLNIQQILEQVQSQAEEMDTMQVGAWPGPPPWLWLWLWLWLGLWLCDVI
jgi:hypothetical protein